MRNPDYREQQEMACTCGEEDSTERAWANHDIKDILFRMRFGRTTEQDAVKLQDYLINLGILNQEERS